VLARAFSASAMSRAVIESDDPRRCARANWHGLRAMLPVARAHAEVLVATAGGALAGALVATPPGRFPLPAPRVADALRCVIGQGWRVTRRWEQVFEALCALHPNQPHWYLAALGVDPSQRGRGFGAALLAHWLARVDRDALPAYLEADSERSVAFYERAGFRRDAETAIFGVRTWRMSRPPARRCATN
jgi:ribosomal protein S18 acetylase RimI-like enzyme